MLTFLRVKKAYLRINLSKDELHDADDTVNCDIAFSTHCLSIYIKA